MKNISIFIPAYNAEKTLESVIDRIPNTLWEKINKVYIINDGSKDNTATIVSFLLQKDPHHIVAIHHIKNEGYGKTVREGLTYCKNDGCDYAVCLHSDGQYPPEVIEQFVNFMENKGISLLQGSRIASGTALSGGMPLYKFICGKILTYIENKVFRLNLTDYHSGFLIYSRKVLEKIDFNHITGDFESDLEIIASCCSAGLTIAELPIPTRYAGEKSYLNPISYGLRVLRVVYRYLKGYYQKIVIRI
ncbi:MAG: glycosyltransferase family 2 protein [Chitinispirillaceae bacterium]|nr:glycosyltransferase family 2 protein [Chitinispirillaceae bacterium]